MYINMYLPAQLLQTNRHLGPDLRLSCLSHTVQLQAVPTFQRGLLSDHFPSLCWKVAQELSVVREQMAFARSETWVETDALPNDWLFDQLTLLLNVTEFLVAVIAETTET